MFGIARPSADSHEFLGKMPIASAVSVACCALFSACSLLVPGDDHYLRDPARVRGEGGEAGQARVEAGSGGERAEGGSNATAGATGDAGPNAGGNGGNGGNGGDGTLACRPGFADCNREANDGCEVDLSSTPENCGGCGEAFACAPDEACEDSQCISLTGCSDGTREGFLPLSNWPRIAGCTAKWPRSSLRAAKTGGACGYETNGCTVPADACGTGWHVCASPPYGPSEISSQATQSECASQPGAFVAAVGDQFCEPCSVDGAGAACCGERCVQQNGNCIYPGMTAWFGMVD